MKLALGEIAALLNSPSYAADRRVEGYSIDSRTIKSGELFFALRGPRFDGHDFVEPALVAGAIAAVVTRAFEGAAPERLKPFLIPVGDTLVALHTLAHAIRGRWGRRLVAVTGSTGKTTTKELIAALLSQNLRVLKSPGNLNNLFGLPLALLRLEPEDEVAVVELAMSAPGEIAHLAQIAKPDIGVVTNVAPVHLEFFDSVESIAACKQELIENLSSRRQEPIAVLNYDDARVRKFANGFKGRVVTFGFGLEAQVRSEGVKPEAGGGSRFRVVSREISDEFRLPLPGRHNVENALAAIAVADLFGIGAAAMKEALAGFKNLPQRGEILTLPSGVTLINDGYNSNPRAMEQMLATVAEWPGARRRIVVAGEMLELGRMSPELHREVGRKIAASRVDWLIAVQGDARYFVEGAVAAGLAKDRGRVFDAPAPAADFCRQLASPGDVILIKGSRGVHLETVAKLLTEAIGRPTNGRAGTS